MLKSTIRKFATPLLALAILAASLVPVQAFSPEEKANIEKIVREYLIANPEIILEVQQALEIKREKEAKERIAKALAENSDLIFRSPNQASIGNKNADVTVVEFFDYNCIFCKRAMKDMDSLLSNDANLQFVMKELPILGEGSVEAHRISTAVYRLFPDRYEEFHVLLLGGNGQKDGNRALRVAQDMNLDIDSINEESKKSNVLGAFREVNDLATQLGINGTPSYVIGDEVIFGALGEQVLFEKIQNVRKCGKTVCT